MNLFFSRCGMKDLMPSTNYPWSDFTYLLISWFYDHLKVKLVKIELNFWKGPYPLISHIWVKLFQFLYIFSDSVEKVDWYQHLTSILAISTIGPELQLDQNCSKNVGGQNGGQMLISVNFPNRIWKYIQKLK